MLSRAVSGKSAENSPTFFPKGCIEAKLWMNFDTTKHVLEAPFQKEYDILLLEQIWHLGNQFV